MKIIFASYQYTSEFNLPETWLDRIRIYTGIQRSLAKKHTVISIEQIDYSGELIAGGVHYHFKQFGKLGRHIPFRLHLMIQKMEPDVVIIHGLHFSKQIILLRQMLGNKVKIIAQHHAEQPFTGFKKLIQLWADRYIDAYLFAARDMGLEWVKRGNLANPDKIHGVMEVSSVFYKMDKRAAQTFTGVHGHPLFLWVGRLDQNKDPLTVVSSFFEFAKVSPTARLYMIYQTEELLYQIKQLLDESPEQRHAIVLVGKVPHTELLYWYNSFDFILSGSFYEGSGTVVCEAMSCGCIPVVTDILSFNMMVDNGRCGFLYQPGNQQALLQVLVQTTKIDIAEKQKNVLAYYRQRLSFDAIASEISGVISSL